MPLKPVPLGDERELFLRHHQRLLRVIAARVSAPLATVEDACAFAWLQLVRHQPERGERLFGWLATVAYHEALRLIRVERAAELRFPVQLVSRSRFGKVVCAATSRATPPTLPLCCSASAPRRSAA